MEYISWFSYLFFLLIILYIHFTQTKNIYYKTLFTFLFLFLLYLPIFPILNIINILLYILLDNPPFIKNIDKEFSAHKLFENNYQKIKTEYYNYHENIDCFRTNNPLLRGIDTIHINNKYCWRVLYLKKTGKLLPEQLEKFPETMNLLKNEQIHNAFFSILDPHVEIKPHFGYYKGYLRYHLGINIPEENGKKPYIICGGEKYEWKEGEGVLFDDMYLHYVNNNTSKPRVVLYLDIKRENISDFGKIITYFGNLLTENSVILNLFVKNQHDQTKI